MKTDTVLGKASALGFAFALLSCAAVEETDEDRPLGEAVEEEDEREMEVAQIVTREEIVEKEIPTVTQRQEFADINRMDQEHFVALGFSEEAAENIVAHRDEEGPFDSREELRDVEGVTDEEYEALSGQLGTRVLAE